MRILHLFHPIRLGNLPNSRIKIGRVNSIELKLDSTITLNLHILFVTSRLSLFIASYLRFINKTLQLQNESIIISKYNCLFT